MTVDVRRGTDVAVSEPFLDLLQGDIVCQKQRCAAVPEIMETDLSQPVLLQDG